jgi:hypothetical protein
MHALYGVSCLLPELFYNKLVWPHFAFWLLHCSISVQETLTALERIYLTVFGATEKKMSSSLMVGGALERPRSSDP